MVHCDWPNTLGRAWRAKCWQTKTGGGEPTPYLQASATKARKAPNVAVQHEVACTSKVEASQKALGAAKKALEEAEAADKTRELDQ